MSTYSDEAVAKLRVVVDVIEREVAKSPANPALVAACAELVGLLALGPAPETRVCHVCHGVGMRAARRCGYCWAALAPLPATSGQVHAR